MGMKDSEGELALQSLRNCEQKSWKVKKGAAVTCRIFVGGLPPSVDSVFLGKFFEEQFGSVEEASVIVTLTKKGIQSRRFGFVTFKDKKSVSAAVQAHYATISDKKVEIKSFKPKLFSQIRLLPSVVELEKGTINIVVKLENDIIVGVDARATRSDGTLGYVKKFMPITKTVLATMAGNIKACERTWKYMEQFVSNNPDATIPEIADGSAMMPRLQIDKKSNMKIRLFVCGFQNNEPRVCVLNDMYDQNEKRINRSTEILNSGNLLDIYSAIGSGAAHAKFTWNIALKKLGGRRPLASEACEMVEEALFSAAVKDGSCGGPFTVLHMRPSGMKVKSCATFTEQYLKYYSRFSSLDDIAVFIFYRPEDFTKTYLDDKLSQAGQIVQLGHPLTRLDGKYYMRRVIFEKHYQVRRLFLQAKDKIHTSPAFSRSSELKLWLLGPNRDRKLFIAHHSKEVLETLIEGLEDQFRRTSLSIPDRFRRISN